MMRILIDTNIFLDLFLARHPFAADAATLWNAQIDGRFEGYVSAITPLNVYYVTRKLSGKDVALIAVAQIIANFQVAWVDRDTLRTALFTSAQDYEDAVQTVCAIAIGADAIATRDPKGFNSSLVKVFSPAELIRVL